MKKRSNVFFIKGRNKIKRRVNGTFTRPRLSVFRSLKHIYVQAINDISGKTIASSSSLDKRITHKNISKFNISKLVGLLLGQRLIKNKIKSAVFDRRDYFYAGNIERIANGIRESGILF